MEDIWKYSELVFIKGGGLTIQVAVYSLFLAVAFGLIGAWGKLSGGPVIKRVAGSYTTVIRGIPDLILMLLIFYQGQIIVNRLGEWSGLWVFIEIDAMTAGVLTIGLIMGAYYTETFRGAYLAIPKGQIEAGIASGMSKSLIFRRIIWPQLMRYALPSFTNNWMVQMKTTALASIIGLQDVVYNALSAGRSERQLFTFLFAALLFFLALTAVSEIILRYLERRYSAGVRRVWKGRH